MVRDVSNVIRDDVKTPSVFDFDTATTNNVEDDLSVLDKDWVSNVFLVRTTELSEKHEKKRYFTTAELKFTDTTMGGNLAINPRPQFTRYADIKARGRITDRRETKVNDMSGELGMGRYYSEVIDDNAQNVYMEFGLPRFNSLTDYFFNATDNEMKIVAKTGRPAIAYNIGKAIGTVALIMAFPVIGIGIQIFKFIAQIFDMDNSFNYYYMRPAMHMYWTTVNVLVTRLSVELGIVAPDFMDKGDENKFKINVPKTINQEDMDYLAEALPGVFSNNNMIDIFAIAARSQVLANKQIMNERAMYKRGEITAEDLPMYKPSPGSLTATINELLSFSSDTDYNKAPKKPKKDTGAENAGKTTKDKADLKKRREDATAVHDASDIETKNVSSYGAYFDSVMRDGGGYAVFKVDHIGSVSESFSNTVGDAPIASTLKGATTKMRNLNFSTAGGNIIPGLGAVIDTVKETATGILDGATAGAAGGIANVLFGSSYMEIPKVWQDSSVSLPSITYKTRLISPYGNTISQLQDIYIPLMMLMAGTLPLQAGKASYESPFLCSVFVKGLQKIKLGMITNLSFTRGTSNLGFNKQRRPLAIDVSFTVTDFSSVLTAPVETGMFGGLSNALSEGSPLDEYLGTLGSRDLLSNKFMWPKLKRKWSRALMAGDSLTSPAAWAFRTAGPIRDMTGSLAGMVGNFSINMAEQN